MRTLKAGGFCYSIKKQAPVREYFGWRAFSHNNFNNSVYNASIIRSYVNYIFCFFLPTFVLISMLKSLQLVF